jgi:hypothetical protein
LKKLEARKPENILKNGGVMKFRDKRKRNSTLNNDNDTPETFLNKTVTMRSLQKENAKLKEQLKDAESVIEFYGIPKQHKDYREALTPARVIKEDLSEYFYNGINLKVSGKKAREYLAKWGSDEN